MSPFASMAMVLGNFIILLLVFNIAATTNTSTKLPEENELKHLSLTVSNAAELIKGGYVYVDKTKFVVQLLKSMEKYVFLARPRHFGKTTFLSTFKEIFEHGDKNLFTGTAIHESDFMWPTHPVISISMSEDMSFATAEEFKTSIIEAVKKVAKSYEIFSLEGTNMREIVQNLISMLHQKFSKEVIILIDAYDFPYTEMHENEEIAEKIEEVLRKFFSDIRSMDADIRFCIVAGIMKLNGCDLHEWTDISFQDAYATIAGFTQEEMERYYGKHIDNVVAHRPNATREQVLHEIQNWYHGHRFSSLRAAIVYSPWSLISYFITKKTQTSWPQWLSTKFMGLKRVLARHPDYAIDYLHGKRWYPKKWIHSGQYDKDWDESINELETLMLLTGCLSIKKYDPKREMFKLGITNREVREAFFNLLVSGFGKRKHEDLRNIVMGVKSDLLKLDLNAFVEKVNAYTTEFLSNSTSPEDHLSPRLPRNKITAPILHVIFRIAMMDAEAEIDPETSTDDRLEALTVFIDGKRYFFELRLSENPLYECLKNYRRRYSGERGVCVGMKFDTKTVRVVDCEAAELSEEGDEVTEVYMHEFMSELRLGSMTNETTTISYE